MICTRPDINWIDVPVGMFTLIGMCADFLFMHGDVADKKSLVHPESKIAVSSGADFISDGVQSKVNAS
jgi:hypothetical protein